MPTPTSSRSLFHTRATRTWKADVSLESGMPYVYGMDQFSSALAAASLVDGQHFTLPGYGTLEGVYVSAQIDHVQREVAPPSLRVAWSVPPVPDAQTFADLLGATGATPEEASAAQDAWLGALGRGTRVIVGDLGGLELDGASGEVRWVGNPEALAEAYWSGGAVALEPLDRPAEQEASADAVGGDGASAVPAFAKTAVADVPESTMTTAAGAEMAVVPGRAPARRRTKVLRYAALLAGVVVGLVALRYVLAEEEPAAPAAVAVAVSNDRLNRSPLDDASVLDEDYETPDYNAELGPGATAAPELASGGFDPADLAGGDPAATAAAPQRAPDGGRAAGLGDDDDYGSAGEGYDGAGAEREYVVIVGSFGQDRNARAFQERLLGDGHLPYVDQFGGLTRVGITVTTTGRRGELTGALTKLRGQYNEGAWILE